MKKILYLNAGHGNFANGINYTPLAHGKFYHFTENKKRIFSAYEGEVNRQIADRLATLMQGTGIEVIKMYHENLDTPHIERVQRANAHFMRNKPTKALWFSEHSNAVGMQSEGASQSARGYSIWTTRGITDSDRVATLVWQEVKNVCDVYKMPMLSQNIDGDVDFEADFDELYFTFMPAVLNECGFFTNIIDARLLYNKAFQQAIAEAYKKAIITFFA